MTEVSVDLGDTRERLIKRGIEQVFGRYYGHREDKAKIRKMLISYPDILSSRFDVIDNSESLNEVFVTAAKEEIDLYAIPFWREKIESLTSLLEDDEDRSRELWYGQADYMLSAASMIDDYDWNALFKAVSKFQMFNNYLRPSYVKIAKNFASSNSEDLKKYAEEEIFFSKDKKLAYPVRGLMYKMYIEQGFLTKKTARKIRSDGSEDSSVSGVKALVENTELYSNSDELLLQFTDSKYERVICELAENLPEYLLASIMGTQFYYAKRMIERRLESIEEEKRAAENG